MKNACFIVLMLLLFPSLVFAQSRSHLSLKEAYAAIEQAYPLLESDSILGRIYKKEIDKLALDRRPDLFLQVEGRIQTETVSFPDDVGIPVSIDLPLYSFKPFLGLNYVMYDGGMHKANMGIKKAEWEVEKKKLEVEAYALRQRIDQIFLGVALFRAQTKLLKTSQKDVEARREILEVGLDNGVVLESDVYRLKVRELELEAHVQQLSHGIEGSLKTLTGLTGINMDSEVELELPEIEEQKTISGLDRPEQELFKLKQVSVLQKEALLETTKRPRLQFFAQTGAGVPNPLNFFDNNLSPYGLAGISFQWKLSDRKQLAHDKEILYLRAKQIQKQKETFEFNMDAATSGYISQVANLEEQIRKDQEISSLQANILSQLASQLENGVITSADYLIQSNAELRARQNLELHKIQLIQAHLDFQTQRGSSR